MSIREGFRLVSLNIRYEGKDCYYVSNLPFVNISLYVKYFTMLVNISIQEVKNENENKKYRPRFELETFRIQDHNATDDAMRERQ